MQARRPDLRTVRGTPARACFVIPTYNEADNITLLLPRLAELYPDPNVLFLVVDDESPDGTGRLVRECAAADARVHLLEGRSAGSGPPTCAASATRSMRWRPTWWCRWTPTSPTTRPTPAACWRAWRPAPTYAIGSRYVPGGSVDESWGFRRRQLSAWGNRLARWIAGLKGVRDCTAGFKAIRATALRAARVQDITVLGYAFQVALLHRLLHSGAPAAQRRALEWWRSRSTSATAFQRGSVTKLELSIISNFLVNNYWTFADRELGGGFFYHIWWLRLTSHRTFIKFSLTGLSGVVVNLGSFHLLLQLGLHRYLASPIAIELSIISNFLVNNYWTFADRELGEGKRIRGLKFNVVSLLALGVSYGSFLILSLLLPGAAPVWLQGLAIVPAVLVNYFLNSYWTFRESGRG